MSHLHAIIPIILHIVNICLTTGDFPISCKSSLVIPLIKKPSLDKKMLNNYRPISNLSFLSNVIEKVIYIRILGHFLDNNIVDSFQSAYVWLCGVGLEFASLPLPRYVVKGD